MMTIREIMTTEVETVRVDTPLKEVARRLMDDRISGLPVVDVDGAVVGVISEADLLMKAQGPDAINHRRFRWLIGEAPESRAALAKLEAETAGEAMTTPAVTIGPDRRVSAAAALMVAKQVNRLPVVDHGRLVGIVTRADLVRAYVRSDEELARTIREDVLLRILWLDPSSFTVKVQNGVATIGGWVERRSGAEMVDRAVRMVPGIVDVHSNVNWSVDDRNAPTPKVDPFISIGPR